MHTITRSNGRELEAAQALLDLRAPKAQAESMKTQSEPVKLDNAAPLGGDSVVFGHDLRRTLQARRVKDDHEALSRHIPYGFTGSIDILKQQFAMQKLR